MAVIISFFRYTITNENNAFGKNLCNYAGDYFWRSIIACAHKCRNERVISRMASRY